MRPIEDEEVRRLLAAARPVRRMTEEERARTARFVAKLAKEPVPRRRAGKVIRWACLAAAAAVAMVFFRGDVPEGGEAKEVVSIEAEPMMPNENDVPWYEPAKIPASREGVSVVMAAPGYGDVCGARVCERDPSCCERAWDSHCDGMLLELTHRAEFLVSVGRCYWFDREICPRCACPMYLKRVEDRDNDVVVGFDGGSGCIRDPAKMLVELKWMCVQGYCEE